MAVTATPIFPQTILSPAVQILPADTTTLKTLHTAGANGSVVMNIQVGSTDTSSKDLQFYLTISSTDYLLSTITIPANSGFLSSVPFVSVFASTQFANMLLDVNGNKALYMTAGAILKVKSLANVTTAKIINVVGQCGDF
jgi:hypothetical protein